MKSAYSVMVTPYRDVHTSTFLTAFKGNASGQNALSLLGRDYLVAAQQPKGVLYFWAWHKACCPTPDYATLQDSLQPCHVSYRASTGFSVPHLFVS